MTAERGADVAAVVKAVLAEFPMSEDGTGHIVDCGWTDDDMCCGCATLPTRIAEQVTAWLGEQLAAAGMRAHVLREADQAGIDRINTGLSAVSMDDTTAIVDAALAAVAERLGVAT